MEAKGVEKVRSLEVEVVEVALRSSGLLAQDEKLKEEVVAAHCVQDAAREVSVRRQSWAAGVVERLIVELYRVPVVGGELAPDLGVEAGQRAHDCQ